MNFRIHLAHDERGSAAVEFALASLFLFGTIAAGLDFGVYTQQKLKLGSAVEQAAIMAFNDRSSAPNVDTSVLTSHIASVVSGVSVVGFQCNGSACGSGAPQSRCVAAPAVSGGAPTFSSPTTGSDGALTCASGAPPGYYLVIRANKPYQAVVMPDKWLGGSTMVEQAVVRLQ